MITRILTSAFLVLSVDVALAKKATVDVPGTNGRAAVQLKVDFNEDDYNSFLEHATELFVPSTNFRAPANVRFRKDLEDASFGKFTITQTKDREIFYNVNRPTNKYPFPNRTISFASDISDAYVARVDGRMILDCDRETLLVSSTEALIVETEDGAVHVFRLVDSLASPKIFAFPLAIEEDGLFTKKFGIRSCQKPTF